MRKKINVLNQSVPFFMRCKTLSLLRLTMLILAMTNSYCFAKDEQHDAKWNAIEYGYDTPYMAETNFKCGNYDVHVTTSCRKVDKKLGRAICYTQHFEFLSKEMTKDFFLFNTDFREEMMVAVDATCFTTNNHHLLEISSANFTNGWNCTNCERHDYFDEFANYLGSSTPSITGPKIVFGYKKLPKSADKKLNKFFSEKATKQRFEIELYPNLIGEHTK
jgi:hypothetical protein